MTRLMINALQLNIDLRGAGPPLVLLHGFTGSGANWRQRAAVYSAQFRTIAVDFLGHGQSDSPADPARYRMERCVEDLLSIIDQVGLARINLLGYSMGGRVALHFAAAHPARVRALIVESASPGLADPVERAARRQSDEALADFIEREGLAAFVERWENLPLFASQARWPVARRAELRTQRLQNNPLGLANALRGLGTGVQSPLWEHLSSLHVPTLLIAGELDSKFTAIARSMAQTLPRSQLSIVPDAGHTVHLEQPAAFDQRVLEFLAQVDSDPHLPNLERNKAYDDQMAQS